MATNVPLVTSHCTSSPKTGIDHKLKPPSDREKSSQSDGVLPLTTRSSTSSQVRFLENNYDWVVIGNGPHGNIFATTMLKKGLPPKKLVMLDPNGPLELWTKLNTNGGWSRNAEEVSRETDVSQSTEQYRTLSKLPLPITNRNLFEFLEGLRADISRLSIPHIKAMATRIRKTDQGYAIDVREGSPVNAKNVVLAIGNYTEPVWPEWAKRLKTENESASIHHIFDQDFDLEEFKKDWKDGVIVGGGPAAINLALILSKLKPGKVTLLMRNPIRGTGVSLVDPCHLPEEFDANHCYRTFRGLPSSEARRKYIEENRPIGAVGKSIDFMAALEDALAHGQLKVIQGEAEVATASSVGIQLKLKPKTDKLSRQTNMEEGIDFVPYLSEPSGRVLIDSRVSDFDRPVVYQDIGLKVTSTGKVVLDSEACIDPTIFTEEPVMPRTSAAVTLKPSGLDDAETPKDVSASSVLLATGFANRRPGGEFLNGVISDLNLGTYADGYPKVDEHLQWKGAPGLFVMGRLGDHQMGPYSWNVAGGIFATKRIVESMRAKVSLMPSSSESLPIAVPSLSLVESDSRQDSPPLTRRQPEPVSKMSLSSLLSGLSGLFSHNPSPVVSASVIQSPPPFELQTFSTSGSHKSTVSSANQSSDSPSLSGSPNIVTADDRPLSLTESPKVPRAKSKQQKVKVILPPPTVVLKEFSPQNPFKTGTEHQ